MLEVSFENFEVLDFLATPEHDEEQIAQILNELLKNEQREKRQYEVDICFITNDEIQEINAEYRGIDKATDVISFALQDDALPMVTDDETFPVLLGDIFVSRDKIKEQAQEYGHSEKRELYFLIVHGFLHLLGYDHMTSEEEREMFAKQDAILEKYSILK